MMIECADVVGGRCMGGNDGTFYLDEKERAKLWKAHMSKIMNEENELDQIADADVLDGPIERVMRDEIMEEFKYVTIGKVPVPTEVYTEMILASGDVGITVLIELYHRILDRKGLPDDWSTSVVIPIFKGKGHIMKCGMHRGVRLLEDAMKIVEKIEKNFNDR